MLSTPSTFASAMVAVDAANMVRSAPDPGPVRPPRTAGSLPTGRAAAGSRAAPTVPLGAPTRGDRAVGELHLSLDGRGSLIPAAYLEPLRRGAHLEGGISRTQADVIAGIATDGDEHEWLARAQTSTVRALKAEARETRERTPEASRSPNAVSKTSETPETETPPCPAADDEPRRRRAFDVPAKMLGKIDAALELAALVAGARMPPGALWEIIAAEYLSGMPPGEANGVPAGKARNVSAGGSETAANTNSAKTPAPPHPPEDPSGVQEWLERESRNWCYLPAARPRLEIQGDWKHLRNRCADDRPRSAWDLHRDMTAALAAERRVAWDCRMPTRPASSRRSSPRRWCECSVTWAPITGRREPGSNTRR